MGGCSTGGTHVEMGGVPGGTEPVGGMTGIAGVAGLPGVLGLPGGMTLCMHEYSTSYFIMSHMCH